MSSEYLIVEAGPEAGRRYDLSTGECVLGRHPDCDIVIEVGAVSRHHAQVVHQGDHYVVEDLKSRNGTYVNEEAVRGRRRLRHGDLVRVCDVSFSYHGDPNESSVFPSDGSSSAGKFVVDDLANSTVLSKLDVSSNRGGISIAASSEAKLAAMLEITQSLAKAVTVEEVLPKVLDSLFKIFVQADRTFVLLADEDGELRPRFSLLRREDENDTLRISSTIVNAVVETKQAVLSADAANDVRFELSESVANFRIRSMMCVPLIDSNSDVLGVLQIDTNDQKKKFEKHDLEVLNSVGAQAAIAIENAHFHEQELLQREVERDLEVAREVQHSFLPSTRPEVKQYDFFDYYRPASQVGGDYYNYIELPDGRLAIVVADVVGHGVAAALLMARLSTEINFSLGSNAKLDAAVTQLNRKFSGLAISRFATMIVVALDPESNELTIVNCGHMPPIIRRSDGQIEEPGRELAGIPIGIADDILYQQFTTRLEEGESVVLYTDGIHEAVNEDNEFFSMGRIRQYVAESTDTLQVMGQGLIKEVRDHLGEGDQEDDICLVCFQRMSESESNAGNAGKKTVDAPLPS